MSQNDQNNASRRRFLKLTAGAAAAAAAVGVLPRMARAAEGLPHLKESDPTAQALQYVEDAGKSKNPQRKAGADCSNCMFYQGKAGDAWGPCQLFPGKDVAAKGWCVSHQAKA